MACFSVETAYTGDLILYTSDDNKSQFERSLSVKSRRHDQLEVFGFSSATIPCIP